MIGSELRVRNKESLSDLIDTSSTHSGASTPPVERRDHGTSTTSASSTVTNTLSSLSEQQSTSHPTVKFDAIKAEGKGERDGGVSPRGYTGSRGFAKKFTSNAAFGYTSFNCLFSFLFLLRVIFFS
jgi:hypothetical protein